jgi:FKBP-type peptidyl-prolyl cis-trans isomerase SlyD
LDHALLLRPTLFVRLDLISGGLMKIAAQTVVKFAWTLEIDRKRVDGTPEGETQTILIGHTHGLPVQLEASLIGLEAGEHKTVSIEPEDAYGVYDPSKRQVVPTSSFPAGANLKIGAKFFSQDQAGKPLAARVIGLTGEGVTVDFNHEFAGKILEYKLDVRSVRAAEVGELEHGHVHGDGGIKHKH